MLQIECLNRNVQFIEVDKCVANEGKTDLISKSQETRQVDQMRLGGRVADSYTYNLEDGPACGGQRCATILDHQALFSS